MTTNDIVAALTAGQTTVEKIKARVKEGKLDALDAIDAIQQFEASRKATATRELSCKVTEKGGVSVYGLNARFPVTLYADQWERLIQFAPTLQQFIVDNAGKLSRKDK